MEHVVDAFEKLLQPGEVGYASLCKLHVFFLPQAGDVLVTGSRKVIQDNYHVTLYGQFRGQMRAYKAGTAGNNNFLHYCLTFL
ncbi:hypothetical protein ES703_84571 [subsurface metagenome]